MIRYSTVILALVSVLPALNAHPTELDTPLALDGLRASSHANQETVPAFWSNAVCVRDQVYRKSGADQRDFFADVRLDWPGVLYRFFNDRFSAAEATPPEDAGSIKKLQAYLVSRYGEPAVYQSWHSAPPQTFEYGHRLRSLGCYSSDGHRAVWLMSHDDGRFFYGYRQNLIGRESGGHWQDPFTTTCWTRFTGYG